MSATAATASPDPLEELQRELNTAHRREAATAEVLRIISRSAFDLQSVLDALVASAAHPCDAPMVAIHVQRDAQLPGRARFGFPPKIASPRCCSTSSATRSNSRTRAKCASLPCPQTAAFP